MVELEVPQKHIPLLFAALKTAEDTYTTNGMFEASRHINKLYKELYRLVYTYGQVEEEDYDIE